MELNLKHIQDKGVYMIMKQHLGNPRIKKQIVKVQVKPSPSGYPCVMQHKVYAFIVLFDSVGVGHVIVPNGIFSLGYFNTAWNMNNFIPFHGRVILDIEKPVSPNATMLNEVEK